MPVKKSKKKAKKADSKKTLRQAIKKAVEKLPGLMIERVRLSELAIEPEVSGADVENTDSTELNPTTLNQKHAARHTDFKNNPQQTHWLWLGVIFFCVIIFGLWGWNMFMVVQNTTQADSTDSWLPDPVSEDLRTVWKEVENKTDNQTGNESLKTKIKTEISSLMIQVNALKNTTTTSATGSIEITL